MESEKGREARAETPTKNDAGKILVIITNADEYEKVGMRTGLWLGELTHFWDFESYGSKVCSCAWSSCSSIYRFEKKKDDALRLGAAVQ